MSGTFEMSISSGRPTTSDEGYFRKYSIYWRLITFLKRKRPAGSLKNLSYLEEYGIYESESSSQQQQCHWHAWYPHHQQQCHWHAWHPHPHHQQQQQCLCCTRITRMTLLLWSQATPCSYYQLCLDSRIASVLV